MQSLLDRNFTILPERNPAHEALRLVPWFYCRLRLSPGSAFSRLLCEQRSFQLMRFFGYVNDCLFSIPIVPLLSTLHFSLIDSRLFPSIKIPDSRLVFATVVRHVEKFSMFPFTPSS